MARQLDGFIEGTIEGITFYRMLGRYYARSKSSLTGKRFWTDAKFEGSRRSSSRFAEANRIASAAYRPVPKKDRSKELYQSFKRTAIALMKEGRTSDEVRKALEKQVCTVLQARAVRVHGGKTNPTNLICTRHGLFSVMGYAEGCSEQKKRPRYEPPFCSISSAPKGPPSWPGI